MTDKYRCQISLGVRGCSIDAPWLPPAALREVRDWEPRLALTDFADGLIFYRSLFEQTPGRLKPGEMGYTESEKSWR